MLPKKFALFLFGFLGSGLMSFVVAAVATYRTIGIVSDYISLWMNA
ncbi:DUF2798 domain-containing protein [Pseudohalocynthiibacter aestuariivivens]|uniref:DUF2798 domain-containing protein n=1 Tax=Pseudohalocynthiibacter aestuariivivens TaxID=1591409 RepID=A0ABV5JBH4_9RHOB|nr:DUF2798 domain-containing protein [Pseudohalocynthiibacter aestuariivivens]